MSLKLRKSDTSSQSTNKSEIGEINEVLINKEEEEEEDKQSIDNNSNNKDSEKSNDDEKYIDQHIKYLNIFYIIQIFYMFFIQLFIGIIDIPYTIFLISIIYNLIIINFLIKNSLNILIIEINGFLCLWLNYIGWFIRNEDFELLCIMPWINMSCPYLFKYWFTSMNQLIEELNQLKYEYNSDEDDE